MGLLYSEHISQPQTIKMAAIAQQFVAKPVVASTTRASFKGAANGAKVNMMQVWSPINNYKYETLSFLPALTDREIAMQVQYLTQCGYVPCIEFDNKMGFAYREHGAMAGYYDGRYWTMWKLPLFGCSDPSEVLEEVAACKMEYPRSYIRVIGFDPVRQVQSVSFLVHKP